MFLGIWLEALVNHYEARLQIQSRESWFGVDRFECVF